MIDLRLGDCRDVLKTLSAQSVQTCITSPPYFGLRDYGVAGQLGLEPTPDAYVAALVGVFREVKRVLRDDETLWLNIGDSFASSGVAGRVSDKTGLHDGNGVKDGTKSAYTYGRAPTPPGLKPKDLIGIPWRVAFALQAGGWYLRSDIIWHKPNPMPESVTDRPTKSHEYLFLLSKQERYWYDADAIREEALESSVRTYRPPTTGQRKRQALGDMARTTPVGRTCGVHVNGRNRRSVWTIAPKPFPGAHFATFPPKLIEPCILAGTSERGCCPHCGAGWRRVVERDQFDRTNDRLYGGTLGHNPSGKVPGSNTRGCPQPNARTLGWQPSCTCPAHEPIPCTVLDPFAGAATTGLVAQQYGRDFIGIDLNSDYLDLGRARLDQNPIPVAI